MLDARCEDLLPVNHIALSATLRPGLCLGSVRPGRGLGHAERLQAQAPGRERGQVALPLGLGAPASDHVHDVHLGVAGRGIAPGGVDRLHDQAGLEDPQSAAAVAFRDERG